MNRRPTPSQPRNRSWLSETARTSLPVRRLLIIAWHAIGLYVTYFAAFLLRFDGRIPLVGAVLFWDTLPVLLLVYLLVFALFRLYHGMWSYFSVDDLARMGLALLTATTGFAVVISAIRGIMTPGFPRSIFVIEFLLMGFWMGGARFAVRYLRQRYDATARSDDGAERLVVVGRIADADLLIRATLAGGIGRIVGVLTDDATQRGLTLHGVPIRGTTDDLPAAMRQSRATCLLALPPFNRPMPMNRLVSACEDLGFPVKFRTIPTLADLATGQISASTIRSVDIEDLLGRGATVFDRTEVRRFLKGKRVMVTGAGGSIGSELCRQIAAYEPKVLVLFELSEFALYAIEQALRGSAAGTAIIPFAGDIRHPEEIRAAMDLAGGIDIIYHAAAYKHVPLMEQNVAACFRTNVLGTARLARVAVEREVDRFVMISSDKAVRPTSIMGITKRLAERVVGEMDAGCTSFVSVRFGNVLGSSGSVVPLFKSQIAKGGPVTVTSEAVRRFFMTIPEAVDLVLMAGTVGHHRDIMVLEMGESIRIVDLARRLIELSGLVPGKDIAIQFVGLRPGEKEYEEVMTDGENVVRTSSDKIWVLRKTPGTEQLPPVPLDRIEAAVTQNAAAALRALAQDCVPEHQMAQPGPATAV